MWQPAAVAIVVLIIAAWPCLREDQNYHQLHGTTMLFELQICGVVLMLGTVVGFMSVC